MPGSSPSRRIQIVTSTSAIIAGLAWVAKDVGSRVSPDSDYWDCNSSYDYVLNGVDTVAFLILGLTLVCLRRLIRSTIGSKKALIGAAAAAGFGVAGSANLLEHCANADALGLAYVIGLMLGMLLLLVFILVLPRGEIPAWCARLLLVGTTAGILFANQGGQIAFGAAWCVFGAFLLRQPETPGTE